MPYGAVRPEPWTQEQELEALKADADSIRQTLKHIEQRISELSGTQTTGDE
jgi:prefoldin subunit 5